MVTHRNNIILTYLIVIAATCTSLTKIFAEEATTAFRSVYLGLSMDSTHPTSFSTNTYRTGSVSPAVHYRFFMHDKWMVSVSTGFKTLHKFDQTETNYFSVTQKSLRLFRIYHPAWFGIGAEGLYMVGAERPTLPYVRDKVVPPDFGVGVSASILYLVSPRLLVHADIARWRGTTTNKLHVIDVSLGINHTVGL